MKLIVGEHCSGKSSKALSLIKDKEKVLYISLDNDSSVKTNIEKNTKADFKYIKNCFPIDIEFSIIGSTYTTIVVDSINFVKLAQEEKNHLKSILKGLEYLHHTYDVEIIAVYSVLRNVEKMRANIKASKKELSDWKIIETKVKNITTIKQKNETPPPIPKDYGVVPENFW